MEHHALKNVNNGTAHFFAFSMIIEGTTEKVLQFSMLIMSIFNQNLGFTEKVCIFQHCREVQKTKNQLFDIDLVIKIFF
jgi:hypothetical protein